MAQASRDQNHVTTALGVSSTDGVTPIRFRVDPATNRLLVELAAVSSGGSANASPAKRDQNHVPVCLGVDSNGVVRPIATDSDGYLLVDFS